MLNFEIRDIRYNFAVKDNFTIVKQLNNVYLDFSLNGVQLVGDGVSGSVGVLNDIQMTAIVDSIHFSPHIFPVASSS